MASNNILDPRVKDLVGQQFYDLTVVSATTKRRRGRMVWLCRCICGTHIDVPAPYLIKGGTKSCGCVATVRAGRDGREYNIWTDMKSRCYNPMAKRYERYGGRGIIICERWHNFSVFFADMGPCPSGHSIDRIDNDGNYEPDNCRWATRKQQLRNFSRNRFITFNGATKCLSEWSEETGIRALTISYRLKAGWSVEDAMTKPVNCRHKPLAPPLI